jgi:DNA-binding LacI/PurR family transcriptional regulator
MAATLKDVAAHSGVSIKTVSNVVHDHPRVAAQTHERVRAAIEALNYRPNLSARHLRKARVGVLALAIPDLANTYFSDIGNAVIAAAAAHAYTVLLDHTGGDRANEILVANGLRPHLIGGVILSPPAVQMADLQARHVGVPIVLLGKLLFSAPWDHRVIGNVSAARTATAQLLHLGRRIVTNQRAGG